MKYLLLFVLAAFGLLTAETPLWATDAAPAASVETAGVAKKGAVLSDTQFRMEIRKAMDALESAGTPEERAQAKRKLRALQEQGRARRAANRGRIPKVDAAIQAARQENREKLQGMLRKHHESMRGELIEDHKKEAKQVQEKNPDAAGAQLREAMRKKKEYRSKGLDPYAH
ncbi:MAG: hypothetical protein IT567_05310 [Alphaproteobacteria bacterium]|nr:hypothetical protein [Alphaproteobacteria bacterium]